MSETFVQFGGWIVAILVAGITALVQWRKGNIDESAMVLGQWRALVEAHQTQIGVLQTEIANLRERLVSAEQRIRDLEDENAGLKRLIAQNSQSAVYHIGKPSRAAPEIDEAAEKLRQAGHNSDNRGDGE